MEHMAPYIHEHVRTSSRFRLELVLGRPIDEIVKFGTTSSDEAPGAPSSDVRKQALREGLPRISPNLAWWAEHRISPLHPSIDQVIDGLMASASNAPLALHLIAMFERNFDAYDKALEAYVKANIQVRTGQFVRKKKALMALLKDAVAAREVSPKLAKTVSDGCLPLVQRIVALESLSRLATLESQLPPLLAPIKGSLEVVDHTGRVAGLQSSPEDPCPRSDQ